MDGITDSMDMNLSKLRDTEEPGMLQSLGSPRIKYELATEQPSPLSLNRMADFCREHTVPGANDL